MEKKDIENGILADANENEKIKELLEDMEVFNKETRERSGFVKKTIENYEKWRKDRKQKLWFEIETELMNCGSLPSTHKPASNDVALRVDHKRFIVRYEEEESNKGAKIASMLNDLLN